MPQKILIVRLSSLGDIVLLTPVLQSLRSKYPQAQIDYLVLNRFAPLVDKNPFLSSVITFDPEEKLKGWCALCRELRAQHYDLLLDLHNNLRSRILGLYFHRVHVLRYRKPRLKRFLLFYLYLNLFPAEFSILNAYYSTLNALQLDRHFLSQICLDSRENEKVRALIQQRGIKGKYVIFLPETAWPTKQYALSNFQELSARITEGLKLPVVWLGTRNTPKLKQILSVSDHNLVGETSLAESLALIQHSAVVVGNDTGLTYAAEALGIPFVLILGPTSRETGAGVTFLNQSRIIERVLWCRPCSQRGNRECYRRKQYCLDIPVDEVYQHVKNMLQEWA